MLSGERYTISHHGFATTYLCSRVAQDWCHSKVSSLALTVSSRKSAPLPPRVLAPGAARLVSTRQTFCHGPSVETARPDPPSMTRPCPDAAHGAAARGEEGMYFLR